MKKIIAIIFILLIGVLVFIVMGRTSTTTEPLANQQQSGQDQVNNLKVDIPDSPPGFNLPAEFSDLDISDYTESTAAVLKKEVEYSAIWTFDKEYTTEWEKMTQDQRNNFELLKESVIQSLTQGVENAGGKFTMTEGVTYDADGTTYGKWELTHKDSSLVKIWRVDFNAGFNDLYGKPFMNIYIAHTKLK